MRRRLPAIVALSCAAAGGGVTSPGCAEFDTTPPPAAHGSIGEEIVEVFCERLARDADPSDVTGLRWKPVCEGRAEPPAGAPPRLVALLANRARLVDALDRVLPEDQGDALGRFLAELLPFFDPPEERLPRQTRALADFLARLAEDDAAVEALARLGTRQGYRPLRLGLGVMRPVMAYPEFDAFADLALEAITEGAAAEELTELQRALALEMATMEPRTVPPGERSTLALVRELMFTEDERFATGGPSWVLMRDARGIALTATDAAGAVRAPFVDVDRDGLADTDEYGRFVGASGEVLELPAPFAVRGEGAVPRDSVGRALRSDGTRFYEYTDASRTMLAGTVAELSPWFAPESPAMMQLGRGLVLLMGGQTEASASYGAYTLRYPSFDTSRGSLFDVVYALGELMHRPQTDDALAVAEALLRDHESETAGVIRAARYMANQGDLYPSAQLAAPSNFWDDLIDLLVRFAQRPGMLEAVMRSFSDPRSAQLGNIYGSLMRYRDRVTYDPAAVNAAPVGFPLDEPVDRAMPDTFDNESLFQRTLALIDGLNGVRVCNRRGARLNLTVRILSFNINLEWPLFGEDHDRDGEPDYDECELINIPNVAEAYALAILGRYELRLESSFLDFMVNNVAIPAGVDVDTALAQSAGIDGLGRYPTPQALNRLVFWGLSDASGTRSCTPRGDGGDCNSRFVAQLFDPVRDRHGNLVIERYHGTIFSWEMPGFYEGMRPLLEVLHRPEYAYDDAGRYVFGELLGTLHRHWASPQSTETCGNRPDSRVRCNPGDPNFSYQSNARSYEPLLADGFVDGELLERLHRLNLALEAIEVRPGTDGVAALAAASADMLDPRRNPDLVDRHGRSTTEVNDGSRRVPMTPLYLVLDALSAMDRDLALDPARRTEWRAARHTIAEQFLGTRTLGEEFRFENQRARAILLTALPFVRERIAEHRAAGDLEEWSRSLHADMAETMREPLMSALVRLLDAVNEDPAARDALGALLTYLMSEASANDAFASMLYGAADALMVLEDDTNIVPLMRALSESMAPNVREVIARGGELDVEGSAMRDLLALVREIQDVDEERTLRTILANAASIPAEGDPITPLETIIDVIAEVNRAEPNAGGSLGPDDYRAVIGHVTDFMTDPDHGLERLTAVVQQRRCFPEEGRPCNARHETMESAGLCYPGATCTCTGTDGALAWRCNAP